MTSKTCFLICPIGSEGSPERKRADYFLKYIIEKTLVELNYNVIRADKIAKPGIITNQIVENLIDADIVIADLKDANPNVFYELGIRHTINKPVIPIYHPNQRIPFDVANLRSIKLDITDLESVDNCINELKKQIKTVEEHPEETTSPFSIAFDLRNIKSSDTSNELILSRILESIGNLRADLRSMKFEDTTSSNRSLELYLNNLSESSKKLDYQIMVIMDKIMILKSKKRKTKTDKKMEEKLLIDLGNLKETQEDVKREKQITYHKLRFGREKSLADFL